MDDFDLGEREAFGDFGDAAIEYDDPAPAPSLPPPAAALAMDAPLMGSVGATAIPGLDLGLGLSVPPGAAMEDAFGSPAAVAAQADPFGLPGEKRAASFASASPSVLAGASG